jgi:hypothetical protein
VEKAERKNGKAEDQPESWEKRSAFWQGPSGVSIFQANSVVLAGEGKRFSPFRKKLGIKEKSASIYFLGPKPAEFHNQ